MYRDPQWVRSHIKSIVDFYVPRSIDRQDGGFFGGLKDDGTLFDADIRHLVDTCRHIYNYATAAICLDDPGLLKPARHGLQFLTEAHRLPRGGFAWVLDRRNVADPTRHCYGHAFVLLAASAAAKARLAVGSALVNETWDLLETHFYDPGSGLYVDQIDGDDWSRIDLYRGQNANMHMCEAMLAAFDATNDARYLGRAYDLARRICCDLTRETDGLIWEHYTPEWQIDWDYNREDPKNLFRPYGYLPGHFVEWTKLLVLLHRVRPEPWMLERARALFDTAVKVCWDETDGGFHYTFAPDGSILDTDRYYWVMAEAIAAAALLADACKDPGLWNWYDRFWQYSQKVFIDRDHGGWYRVLTRDGSRYDDLKSPPAKTDYHPLSACVAALTVIGDQDPEGRKI